MEQETYKDYQKALAERVQETAKCVFYQLSDKWIKISSISDLEGLVEVSEEMLELVTDGDMSHLADHYACFFTYKQAMGMYDGDYPSLDIDLLPPSMQKYKYEKDIFFVEEWGGIEFWGVFITT